MRRVFHAVVALSLLALPALGQSAEVAFGAAVTDRSLPVEITADELQIDQETGQATFIGNVVAGQGEMRLSAGRVQVLYASSDGSEAGQIDRLVASEGVTLVNATEAAEAQEATYVVSTSEIVMTGDVILTQGPNAVSAERLIVDLRTGNARLEGRVKTILNPGASE